MAENDLISPPPPVTPAPPTTVDDEAARQFWSETGRAMVRENMKRLDRLGQLVIAVAGLLAGLYTGALAMIGLRPEPPIESGEQLLFLLPLLFLLFTLLFAGGTFFLEKSDFTPRSWRGTRDVYLETARNKALFVRTALLLLALSVVAMIMAMWIYLR